MTNLDRTIEGKLILITDFWHESPRSAKTRPGFKEWSHFSVLGADFDLLVNFSLMSPAGTGAANRAIPRLTVLFADAEGWCDGDVEEFTEEETDIVEARPHARLKDNSVQFLGDHYRLNVALSHRPLVVALDLYPVVRPVIANNVPLSSAESVRWLVVPHLRARGEIVVANKRYPTEQPR